MTTARDHMLAVAEDIATRCKACKFCFKECAFLQEYGMPDAIARGLLQSEISPEIALECSLCGLCTGVCTVRGLDPSALFQAMRMVAMQENPSLTKRFKRLLAFETTGLSRAFSLIHLPEGGKTLLFPGCNMPGSRPETVWGCFELLRQADPDLGLALSCCAKPSKMLGLMDRYETRMDAVLAALIKTGVQEVLTMCPNCTVTLKEAQPPFAVRTVYEALAERVAEPEEGFRERIRTGVHDPCVLRGERGVHEAVRTLLWNTGSSVAEMRHAWHKTYCCGEGGGVEMVRPEFAQAWRDKRLEEATNRRVATYCGGCARKLGTEAGAVHLLDLVLGHLTGESVLPVDQWPHAPMTYLNRLKLKHKAAVFFKAR